jgi:hypothetical protein
MHFSPAPTTTAAVNETSTSPAPTTTAAVNETSTSPAPTTTAAVNETSTSPAPTTTAAVNETNDILDNQNKIIDDGSRLTIFDGVSKFFSNMFNS